MAGFLDDLLSNFRAQLERHRNRPLLRGAMAACALAATADGEVRLSERVRVDQILETYVDHQVAAEDHDAVAGDRPFLQMVGGRVFRRPGLCRPGSRRLGAAGERQRQAEEEREDRPRRAASGLGAGSHTASLAEGGR